MTINNFTQFSDLLSRTQLVHQHPAFGRLVVCMMTYNSICNCGGTGTKQKQDKHGECNRIYRECIGLIEQYKAHLFQGCSDNTITFCIDGNQAKTIGR